MRGKNGWSDKRVVAAPPSPPISSTMALLPGLVQKLEHFLEDFNRLHVEYYAAYRDQLEKFRSLTISDDFSVIPCLRQADSWTNQNSQLSIYLHDFRKQSTIIGNTSVKLALLVNTMKELDFGSNEFESIIKELDEQMQTLYNIFVCCLQTALSHPLYDIVFKAARYATRTSMTLGSISYLINIFSIDP
jgi:hypothetical protein